MLGLTLLLTSFQTNDLPMSANDPYQKTWVKIDSLEGRGLYRSALEEVNGLYRRAQADNRTDQYLKAVMYQARFTQMLEEEGIQQAVDLVRRELQQAGFPAKPVLQSILAEAIQKYADQYYYRFEQRTAVADDNSDDIQTWSLAKLHQRSRQLYLASLEEERTLTYPIDRLPAIVDTGVSAGALRPTLFDFLAQRAIVHLKSPTNYLTEPVYGFRMDNPDLLQPASGFVDMPLETADTLSDQHRVLKIYQQLLSLHEGDGTPAAYVHADLSRLQFVYDNAAFAGKATAYRQALEHLLENAPDHPVRAEIYYKLAQHLASDYKTAYQENPVRDNPVYDYPQRAKALCEQAIATYPGSYGAQRCQSLLVDITRRNMILSVPEVIVPNQPELVGLTFTNLNRLYLKIYRIAEGQFREIRSIYDPEEKIKRLEQLELVRAWEQSIPNEGDYWTHHSELALEPLPEGYYLLLASNNEALSDTTSVYEFTGFVSSHISVLRRQEGSQTTFLVTDRQTGAPLANVTAEVFVDKYRRATRDYRREKVDEYQSDKNGFIRTDFKQDNYIELRFHKGRDTLFLRQQVYNYFNRSYNYNPERQMTHFFLDRAIYRPGQTAYFKGIALRQDLEPNSRPEILPNRSVTVTLIDANGQEVSRQDLQTNAYGSFNGSFILPQRGLRGQFSIRSSIGNAVKYFRMEEYKRPKFEVSLPSPEGDYQINDEITVEGNAKAYAGNAIERAEVVYQVKREARFPFWPWWRGYFPPSRGSSQVLAQGTTTTDEQGKFKITFPALPDPNLDPDERPIYTYQVKADVIDITGETHSATLNLRLGYQGLQFQVDIPKEVDNKKPLDLRVLATNLQGTPQAVDIEYAILPLDRPTDAIFIDRYWQKPDRWIIPKQQYHKDFPHYAYQNEDDIASWKRGVSMSSGKISGNAETFKKLDIDGWDAGHYLLVLNATDSKARPVELEYYFQVYDSQAGKLPSGVAHWGRLEETRLEPGQQAQLQIATGYRQQPVLLEITRGTEVLRQEWITANDWERIRYKVKEADRGNLHFLLTSNRNNREDQQSFTLEVPFSNKKLDISYETFRDHLLPGEQEEWRIKISGPDKEAAAAEVVATLYDASLEQFASNTWSFPIYPNRLGHSNQWMALNYRVRKVNWRQAVVEIPTLQTRRLPQLINYWSFGRRVFGQDVGLRSRTSGIIIDPETYEYNAAASPPPPASYNEAAPESMAKKTRDVKEVEDVAPRKGPLSDTAETDPFANIPVRTNLDETVFFLPDLRTDEEGSIIIRFTMNEALTRWRFLGLAHTKDLKYGRTENTVVTQKPLMIVPNAPRFFREGDRMEYTAKVTNLSDSTLTGQARLDLSNTLNEQSLNDSYALADSTKSFTLEPGRSQDLRWSINIPKSGPSLVTHRVVAQAGDYADGEASSLPVLTNRVLVTETLPLSVRKGQTKTFTHESLATADRSPTLEHKTLTLEFTANPAWLAVKALPYLMEYPHQCSEQIFSRYYANTLAAQVANAHPKIKHVFEAWKIQDTDALESELMKNQELKSAILEETPWVMAAQTESEQRKRIGLLFDLNRMAAEQEKALAQLQERQEADGGFAWFPGGRSNWYITQHLVTGFGHLDALGVKDYPYWVNRALYFVDEQANDYYRQLKAKAKKGDSSLNDDHLSALIIHYLYARSFYPEGNEEIPISEALEFFKDQARKYWTDRSIYQQGMIALALSRMGDVETPDAIIASLEERALHREELGMYWNYSSGFYWYQAPIETHSLMIEVFDQVAQDPAAVEELQLWLLKNKETNHWKTTKATAEAVYALLLTTPGDSWVQDVEQIDIDFQQAPKSTYQSQLKAAMDQAEAGTGYFKASWTGDAVSTDFASVRVRNKNEVPAWGALYWQYLEDMGRVDAFEKTPLKLQKALYQKVNTDRGEELRPINEDDRLEPGELLTVRLELRVDRDMEYVHLKDTRAAALEPISTLSQYRFQDGLGYYESPGDAATHFFMAYLPKGNYVFEYDLRVVHRGTFSNGLSSIQCMYAPAYTSHSQGQQIVVD